MKLKYLLLFVLISCAPVSLIAQQGLDAFAKAIDFLPPPPNATAIIKHANLSINKNTGSPNINIPLYPISGTKLHMGVSVRYASTGIKVDEIASRAGMGWTLDAGGVVTRTVRGFADELNPRLTPTLPFTNTVRTFAFFKNSVNGTPQGDAEPDLFNFSMGGVSGTFVLDKNMQPVILSGQKYKISLDFSTSASWTVKITTTEGINYYFGGTGATEQTKREATATCGKNTAAYLPVSWYLKKVEHPNGEVITLSYTPITYIYDTGFSESQQWRSPIAYNPQYYGGGTYLCQDCQVITPVQRCINSVNTQGVLLTTITSNTNHSITISYKDRTDCTDKLIDKIQYNGPEGNYGKFVFDHVTQTANSFYQTASYFYGYDKVSYLSSLKEYSSKDSLINQHLFYYNDPGARPARLSYAQDHWGYFNGVNNNTFMPLPDSAALRSKFYQATANRDPQEGYADKGLLSKIIYPTGATDSIVYEGNKFAGNMIYPNHTLYGESTGSGLKDPNQKTYTFTVPSYQPVVILNYSCIKNAEVLDSLHIKGTVNVLGPNGFAYNDTFNAPYNRSQPLALDAGTYTLKVNSNGNAITTNASITYKAQIAQGTSPKTNQLVGGSRVKSITTYTPGFPAETHRYYYGLLENKELSSLASARKPLYVTTNNSATSCQFEQNAGAPIMSSTAICMGYGMYSSSLTNIGEFSGNAISYAAIVESFGNDFENGGIYTKFKTGTDALGQIIWGHDLPGAPLSNFSIFFNGKVSEETTLKKTATGTLIPVKTETHTYKIDPSESRIVSGYTVQEEYVFNPTLQYQDTTNYNIPINSPAQLAPFSAVRYDMMAAWVYNDTTRVTNYDLNGLNPVTNTTVYQYNNPVNRQLTHTYTSTSDNGWAIERKKYPNDFTTQPVYAAMVNKNIISTPVDLLSFKNDTLNRLSEVKMNYSDWGNGNYELASVDAAYLTGAYVNKGTIDRYNTAGNIQQYTTPNGVVTAIFWGGPGMQYPFAKVVGATYVQAASKLSVAETSLNTLDEAGLKAQADLIRAGLPGTQVTTYTFKQKVGVSSIVEPRGDFKTFTYDDRDRFSTLYDRYGNILTKYKYKWGVPSPLNLSFYQSDAQSAFFTCQSCVAGYSALPVLYSLTKGAIFSTISTQEANTRALVLLQSLGQEYANQYSTCTQNMPVFWNDQVSVPFTKQCPANYTGETKNYVIPANTYSAPTKQDANALALYHANLEGQAWVNANAQCISNCTPANCTGEGYKCVNGFCEYGSKIVTSSAQIHGSVWQCTYYYKWSDGTQSDSYSGTSSTPCATVAN